MLPITLLLFPAMITIPSSPRSELDLPSVAFFGRTLTEYAKFFSLDIAAWRGRDVLDVAAGPSSFTAEACARGVDAVAVDPLYGCPHDTLATHVQLDYGRMGAAMQAKPELFRFKSFPSIRAAEEDRRGAAQRFLSDYAAHFVHNRYVGGALPQLPFLDRSFDLVLCAHLLFVHGRAFDLTWHVEACRELARVSAGEVLLHPLCGPDGRPYASLARLRRELKASGIVSEVRAVDYEFFAGANSMLRLRRE